MVQRKTSKKPSRKGTVANRIIKRMKTKVHQATLPKIHINNSELENLYSFTYLGADIPADGNPAVAVEHRKKTLPGDVLQNIEQHSNQPNSLEAQESDCTKHSLGKQP